MLVDASEAYFTTSRAAAELSILRFDDKGVMPANRKTLHEQVSHWEMSDERAENGQHAIEVLRAAASRGESCELAILDRQMPEMDGMQLADQIKTDPILASTQLLVLTSIGERSDDEERDDEEAYRLT